MAVTPKTVDVDVKVNRVDDRIRAITAADLISRTDAFAEWLRKHGVEPEQTFQVDIVGDWLVAYCFAWGPDGETRFIRQHGPHKGEVAVAEPKVVAMATWPPEIDS